MARSGLISSMPPGVGLGPRQPLSERPVEGWLKEQEAPGDGAGDGGVRLSSRIDFPLIQPHSRAGFILIDFSNASLETATLLLDKLVQRMFDNASSTLVQVAGRWCQDYRAPIRRALMSKTGLLRRTAKHLSCSRIRFGGPKQQPGLA